MRIGEVIGTVTLSRVHPSLTAARWVIVVPFSLDGLSSEKADGEDLIVFDALGAGKGSRIGFSEGGEAAAPFYPAKKPVDAYAACILDQIAIDDERRGLSPPTAPPG